MSRKRLIFYVLGFIGSICFWLWDGGSYQSDDRIRVTEHAFAAREYLTLEKLKEAIAHGDNMTILQYLYDEEIRSIQPGTKGKVVFDSGRWIQVNFDDESYRRWWVLPESIEADK